MCRTFHEAAVNPIDPGGTCESEESFHVCNISRTPFTGLIFSAPGFVQYLPLAPRFTSKKVLHLDIYIEITHNVTQSILCPAPGLGLGLGFWLGCYQRNVAFNIVQLMLALHMCSKIV